MFTSNPAFQATQNLAQPAFITNASRVAVTPASVIAPSAGASLLSALPSILSTGLAAFTQFQALSAQHQFGKFQAGQLRLQSQAQNLELRQQALAIRKSAMENAAKARALFAGRGIARAGTAARAIEQSFINAEEDIEQARLGTSLRQIGIEGEASMVGIQSRLQGINRLINVGNTFSQGLLSLSPKNLRAR